MLAVCHGDPVIVTALIEAGAPLHDHNNHGYPAFALAHNKTTQVCAS